MDHLGVISQTKSHRQVPLCVVRGLFSWLILDLSEISGGDVSHGEGSAFLLTKVHVGRGGGHYDDPSWANHLELQAAIVRDNHELSIARLPQQSMVGAGEVDHLKVEHLLLEVGGVPECDRELDASKRSSLNPREEPKEGGSTRSETGPRDPHAV